MPTPQATKKPTRCNIPRSRGRAGDSESAVTMLLKSPCLLRIHTGPSRSPCPQCRTDLRRPAARLPQISERVPDAHFAPPLPVPEQLEEVFQQWQPEP